jgi:hypothetical protein
MGLYLIASTAVTIAAVFIAHLYVDTPTIPYWPIELSRAANSYAARRVFLVCVLATYPLVWVIGETVPVLHTLGMFIAALVTDEMHILGHSIGIGIVATGAALHVYLAHFGWPFLALGLAQLLVLTSVLLKAGAVLERPLAADHWIVLTQTPDNIGRIIQDCLLINTGKRAPTELQLRIYRLTGLIQWIVLLLVVSIY